MFLVAPRVHLCGMLPDVGWELPLTRGSQTPCWQRDTCPCVRRPGVWGSQAAALAPMKGPPRWVLAAVGMAVSSGAPWNPNSRTLPGRPTQTGGLQACTERGRARGPCRTQGRGRGFDVQHLDSDAWGQPGQAHPARHLPIPTERGPPPHLLSPHQACWVC